MKRGRKFKKDLNLIPMINIIFLLLIFFMLTGVIQKKNNINVERPQSINSKIEKNKDFKTSIILIKSSNKIFFEDKEVDHEFLKSKFQNYNDESKIVLEVDKNLPVQNFAEILSIFKKNKFNKVFVRSVKVDEN